MEAEWRPRAEEHATTVSAACELSEGAEPEQRKEEGDADAATIEVSSHHVWSIP